MEQNGVIVGNYRISINGTELNPEVKSTVESVMVEDEINLPAMFTIKLGIFDFIKGDWQGIDLNTLKPGDEVKIAMGADQTTEMMVGEITALDVNFDRYSYVEVRGFDRLHRLRFGTRRRSFQEMKDSDIVSKIASESGLTPQVEETKTVQSYLFQNNQSNYDFLLERAERLGYEVAVQEKKLFFRPSQAGKGAEITLEYGVDLDRLSLLLNTLTKGSEVEVRGWDPNAKKEITAKATSGSEASLMGGKQSGLKLAESSFEASPIAVTNQMITDAAEAEDLAKAQYNLSLSDFITGEGKSSGNPLIRAGKNIEIKGIGPRFSGLYYIVSSIHSIGTDGYTTEFKVKRTGI